MPLRTAFVLLAVAWAAGCKPQTGAPVTAAPTTSTAPAASGTDPKNASDSAATRRAAAAAKEQATRAAAEAVPVETAPITRGPITAFLSFNSTLETEAAVDIYPQTGGQVEKLLVEEGRVVKEGDALLQIEDRELRVDLAERSANFEHLKLGFGRIDDLFQRNLINKQEYDDKRYQLEQARLQLERAKLRLDYATVRAPFDGVIATREAQVGARVGTGTKLFSMVKLDELVARVFVPGRYLAVVAENQPATITSEFLPDRSFAGWVKRISPVIDPKSGTFKVTVGVKARAEPSAAAAKAKPKLDAGALADTAAPGELPPGLFVGVRIVTDTRPDAVLLPKRAIVYEGGERFAFVVVDGRAMKRRLVAGYEDSRHIEAQSGFEVGTPVIVLGHSGLKDGALVRVVNQAQASETTGEGAQPAKAASATAESNQAGG